MACLIAVLEALKVSTTGICHCVGGWSVLGVNTSTSWTLNNQEGILQEHLVGSQAFFNVLSLPDPMNSSRNLWTVSDIITFESGIKILDLQIIPGGLTVPASSAYESDFVKQTVSYQQTTAEPLIGKGFLNPTYT